MSVVRPWDDRVQVDGEDGSGIKPIDWEAFWATEVNDAQFLMEPLVAIGRQTAIYSVAKEGKSLLILDMVAAAVTGKSVLGLVPGPPIRVVYLLSLIHI